MPRALRAAVRVPKPGEPRVVFGSSKLALFSMLKLSKRNWTLNRFWNGKFVSKDQSKFCSAGPVKAGGRWGPFERREEKRFVFAVVEFGDDDGTAEGEAEDVPAERGAGGQEEVAGVELFGAEIFVSGAFELVVPDLGVVRMTSAEEWPNSAE